MRIKIKTVNGMIDSRIEVLSEQIRAIQEDERIIRIEEEILKRKAICDELLELKEDLREIERMC